MVGVMPSFKCCWKKNDKPSFGDPFLLIFLASREKCCEISSDAFCEILASFVLTKSNHILIASSVLPSAAYASPLSNRAAKSSGK